MYTSVFLSVWLHSCPPPFLPALLPICPRSCLPAFLLAFLTANPPDCFLACLNSCRTVQYSTDKYFKVCLFFCLSVLLPVCLLSGSLYLCFFRLYECVSLSMYMYVCTWMFVHLSFCISCMGRSIFLHVPCVKNQVKILVNKKKFVTPTPVGTKRSNRSSPKKHTSGWWEKYFFRFLF